MKGEMKKKLIGLILVIIIIFSFLFVITQTQIENIKRKVENDELIPLYVKIFYPEKTGIAPFTIILSSLVLYSQGYVLYHWDFGDNESSNEKNPTHIYKDSGKYICNLTVTDENGESSSDSIEINVNSNNPPNIGFTISKTTAPRRYFPFLPFVFGPLTGLLYNRVINNSGSLISIISRQKSDIFCEAQINDPEGDEIVLIEWKLEPPPYQKMGRTIFPEHYFQGKNITFPLLYVYRTGNYYLTLKVIDSSGNIAEYTNNFKVRISKLEDTGKLYTDIRIYYWPLYLKPSIGNRVTSFIKENIWPLFDDFPVLQNLFKILLFRWQINIDEG